MSHFEQRVFIQSVKIMFPNMFARARVLEVGSLDINGSVRDFFTDCAYMGADLEAGPGVDLVAQGQDLDFPTGWFDTTISAECFEHNPYWLATFVNMHRMTRRGGLVVFTCATAGRPEHGTTRTSPADSPFTLDWDYYRNLTESDFRVLDLDRMFSEYEFDVNGKSHDLYFFGIVKK